MLNRREWLRATLVIAQMMTTRLSLRCLHGDMTVRPMGLAQLHHNHHRLTLLSLLFLSG